MQKSTENKMQQQVKLIEGKGTGKIVHILGECLSLQMGLSCTMIHDPRFYLKYLNDMVLGTSHFP